LAKLEEKRVTPSRQADRRALIRRATYDLTGLPPSPQEVEDYLADQSPEAFARVVDRLLGSPRYGERWGRHWLDVARYADTKGYVFEEERRYPFAYTYRDFVVRAFNDDLPYDQFLVQQIAADRLPPGPDKRTLAAMGFLTLGRRLAAGDGPGRCAAAGAAGRLPARQPRQPRAGGAAAVPRSAVRRAAPAVHRRQRPAGAGAGRRLPGQPADGPRDGQPRLAVPL